MSLLHSVLLLFYETVTSYIMILPTVAKWGTGNQPSCKRRNTHTHIQHKRIKERRKKLKQLWHLPTDTKITLVSWQKLFKAYIMYWQCCAVHNEKQNKIKMNMTDCKQIWHLIIRNWKTCRGFDDYQFRVKWKKLKIAYSKWWSCG